MKKIYRSAIAILSALSLFVMSGCGDKKTGAQESKNELLISYSFDEDGGNTTKNKANGDTAKIEYVFNAENQDQLFKESSDPLRKVGVSGNSLYMDGFSTCIKNRDFQTPTEAITMSAWVAPRVFENVFYYGDGSPARGNTRLTGVIN